MNIEGWPPRLWAYYRWGRFLGWWDRLPHFQYVAERPTPQDDAPFSHCDVGGCGNAAVGWKHAIFVAEAGSYLEVSLCGDHPELRPLDREVMEPVTSPGAS